MTILQVYKAQINPDMESDLEVNFIGLVDKPAIERNFQAFEENKVRAKFALDNERRIISGPAMLCGVPIYRNDQYMGEYMVVFDAQGIFSIVRKFAAKGYMQNVNLFHDDGQQPKGITIFNSFITDEQMGILPPKGFEDTPWGSWFVSMYVDNQQTWDNEVKSGKVKGFSVEGLFTYIPVKMQKMTLQQVYKMIEHIEIED